MEFYVVAMLFSSHDMRLSPLMAGDKASHSRP
jgi:hypothetical protein